MLKAALVVLLCAYIGHGRRITAKDPAAFNPAGPGLQTAKGKVHTRIASRPVMLDGQNWDPMSLNKLRSPKSNEARLADLLTKLAKPRSKSLMKEEERFLPEDDFAPNAPAGNWIDAIPLNPFTMFAIYIGTVITICFLAWLWYQGLGILEEFDRCDPNIECCKPPCADIGDPETPPEPLYIPNR
mmetsp:Transcript_148957/g.271074  ORF Transcript_148957/g.271074 Transcript_148957/m.271074 type:complete len:185 (-) Transcript_148957:93-647(-)